jgi:hypothetical protein
VPAHLLVEPVDPDLQRVDHRQVVLDHLAGHRRQFQAAEPGPARAAPAPDRPVLAVIGQDGVDPVAQQRP